MNHYKNVLSDNIFPSFIVSCTPEVNMQEIKEEAYLIKENFTGRKKSNQNGYQSPTFEEKSNYKNFDLLMETVGNFAYDVVNERGLNLPRPSICWWMNINQECQYNIIHNHGRADLIGVYYISAPENSGELVIVRNDGTQYGSLYRNMEEGNISFTIPAENGRLYLIPGHLWHYVRTSQSKKDRISVSFNIYFDA